MTACRYFDGSSSHPHAATAAAVGGGLRITADAGDRQVDGPFDGNFDGQFDQAVDRHVASRDLTFAPASGAGPARIAFRSEGLCEFDDPVEADALFHRLGHRPSAIDVLLVRPRNVIAITVVFVAIIAGVFQWGIPWAADVVVSQAPGHWDEAFGDRVMRSLDDKKVLRTSMLDWALQKRLIERFDALRWPAGGADQPKLRGPLLFRRFGAPNAFALPGGTIVVTDEIVGLANGDDDAILAVLAHEAGHVRHRDVMRQLLRSTMSSALAAWYFGDASSAFGAVAGGLGTMRYSRAAEHEADLYALETMRLNGLSTRPAAALFRRLESWQPVKQDSQPGPDGKPRKPGMPRLIVPEYLSTHPATEDRIRLYEDGHE